MDQAQRAAFLQAQATAALIEALGMTAENQQRAHRAEAMAYTSDHFDQLIIKYQIGWNDAIELLRG